MTGPAERMFLGVTARIPVDGVLGGGLARVSAAAMASGCFLMSSIKARNFALARYSRAGTTRHSPNSRCATKLLASSKCVPQMQRAGVLVGWD